MIMNKLKILNFKLKIPAQQAGFTVLESIVAIFVLSLTISGVFSAVQGGLSQTITAKDEVRAFYLAQEAIEIIRNKRDNNQLNKIVRTPLNSWLYGISQDASDFCYFGKVCRIDVVDLIPEYCGTSWGSCTENLKQNPITLLYNYSTGNTTNFKREIQLEFISTYEIAVTVRVSWTKGVLSREFKAKTHLFNWIP